MDDGGIELLPLACISRRFASSKGSPSQYGSDETIASNASMTETMRDPIGISSPLRPPGYPVPS